MKTWWPRIGAIVAIGVAAGLLWLALLSGRPELRLRVVNRSKQAMEDVRLTGPAGDVDVSAIQSEDSFEVAFDRGRSASGEVLVTLQFSQDGRRSRELKVGFDVQAGSREAVIVIEPESRGAVTGMVETDAYIMWRLDRLADWLRSPRGAAPRVRFRRIHGVGVTLIDRPLVDEVRDLLRECHRELRTAMSTWLAAREIALILPAQLRQEVISRTKSCRTYHLPFPNERLAEGLVNSELLFSPDTSSFPAEQWP